MAGSIGGLASGLDTASIISQLMQLEAIPQSRLKTQVTTQQTAIKSLQDLNTKIASLATKAAELAKPDGWSPVTSTSSSDKVSISTTVGATATSLDFTVGQTAKAHTLSFATPLALTGAVVPEYGTSGKYLVTLTKADRSTVDIDTGDGTLQGLVNAVNASGSGYRATTLNLGDGTHRLRLESSTTGAASSFSLAAKDGSPLLGGSSATVTGQDAQIAIGTDTISSPSNTFSSLLPGVSVTLAPDAVPTTAVTISLATDAPKISAGVKELVTQLNAILDDIDKSIKPGLKGAKAGPLAGDSTMRGVRDALMSSLYSTSGGSLAGVGIELDKYGKLTFNEDTFKKAYEADPVTTAAKFTKATTDTGFADRLASIAKLQSDPYDGAVSQTIKSRETTVDRLNDSIDRWDIKLELRRSTLTRQYTSLETALSKMQGQGNWLAGQLSSMSRSS